MICGSTIAVSKRDPHIGPVASENRKAEEQHELQRSAMEAEKAELRTALASLPRPEIVSAPDYDRYVTLAAKGLAQRDSYPMPKSVTTPDSFYRVMAGAALQAIDFQAILGQLEQAKQQLEVTQRVLRVTERTPEDHAPTGD